MTPPITVEMFVELISTTFVLNEVIGDSLFILLISVMFLEFISVISTLGEVFDITPNAVALVKIVVEFISGTRYVDIISEHKMRQTRSLVKGESAMDYIPFSAIMISEHEQHTNS